jgi:hypothetical protein
MAIAALIVNMASLSGEGALSPALEDLMRTELRSRMLRGREAG